MPSQNILLIILPIVAVFGITLWIMIFLNTYRHFPKMNPEERIRMCIENATIITLILIGIIYLFLWFIFHNFIQ